MPNGIPDNSNQVAIEGRSIVLDFMRTSDFTGTLTWTIPSTPRAYSGILILGSRKQINPSNFPTDSVKYTPSNSLKAPADMIGNASVVGAFYNDRTTTTLDVVNLDPDEIYYFSAHLITNIRTYHAQGVRSYPEDGATTIYAGDMDKRFTPPTDPVVGQVYFDETQKIVFFWDGDKWGPTSAHTVISGTWDPNPALNNLSPQFQPSDVTADVPTWFYSNQGDSLPDGYPRMGDFFYNTHQHMLKSWNGTSWIEAQSPTGTHMAQKSGVGSDDSYVARAALIDILKKQLGYPKVCVELEEDHYNIAITNAVQEMRRRTDTAYHKQYFFMYLNRFQDIYYLNDASVGTDKIVDIQKILRLNLLGLANFAPDNIYAQQFLNMFYAPGVQADLVSVHLIAAMSEIYQTLFAGDIAFNWREATREMRIYRKMNASEKVLLETSCEKPEQEILQDRYMSQWIQNWAMSECMFILANIRGKYANLPGPGGGLQLNADTLLSEATRMQEQLLQQVQDMEVGQGGSDNFYPPLLMG